MTAMALGASSGASSAASPGGMPGRTRAGRGARGAAIGLSVAVPLLIVVDVVLHVNTGSTVLTSWWLGDAALAGVLAVPGILVAFRRPDNAIGWLLCLASLTTALAGAGREYLIYGFLGGNLPGWLWIGWFCDSIYMMSMAVLPVVLMLFPDGRPMSRRAGWLLALPVGSMTLGVFGSLFYKGDDLLIRGRVLRNPTDGVLPRWLPEAATNLATMLFFASVLVAIGVMTLRYRRSVGEVRLQMKWVVWAGAFGVLELCTEMLPSNPVATVTGPLASGLLTASVCIAILRHRMFDIDLVINRTLVFAALTAVVVGTYVGVVTLCSALLDEPVHVGVGLLATALVAVLFAPARARVQAAVDRLVYGQRKNPYGAMAQLGRRLETDARGELDVVVGALTQVLKLPYVALLDPDGALLAEAGRPSRAGHVEVLRYQGSCVGRLVVEPRARRGLARDEQRLIADLGRQIAAAVHAVRLSADLQASRLRLVSAKEEERRRLRRDLHDGLGPKLAALGLKLDAARTMVDRRPDDAKRVVGEVTGDIRATIDDVRHLVYGLRPPALDELGLVAAVRECVQRFESPDGPAFTVQAPDELPALPAAVEVAVYWIVNEAVTNVVRHAAAGHCAVTLALGEGAVLLSVVDDGAGLGDWRAGVGTSSMAERAGELGGLLRLESPRRGTRLDVTIPVAAQGSGRA